MKQEKCHDDIRKSIRAAWAPPEKRSLTRRTKNPRFFLPATTSHSQREKENMVLESSYADVVVVFSPSSFCRFPDGAVSPVSSSPSVAVRLALIAERESNLKRKNGNIRD